MPAKAYITYAKVVLGLPVEGPFDYLIPHDLQGKVKSGARVWVSFGLRKLVGYVVGLANESKIKNIKPILDLIDESPILDKNMLLFTRHVSNYYCCCWGEVIETALPEALRRGKKVSFVQPLQFSLLQDKPEVMLIHDLNGKRRWEIYLKEIKETLEKDLSVIVLLPNIDLVTKVDEIISSNLGISPAIFYRKKAGQLNEWLKAREGKVNIVLGTRSAIFAPLNNLGLVIVDEEQDIAYKQDQVPHYHARKVAFMRISLTGGRLILGSSCPSLESLYLAKRHKIKYTSIERKAPYPEIKIVDTRTEFYRHKKEILSRYLEDLIAAELKMQSKILLFLNRRGFATFAYCRYCQRVLRCPRCHVNLVYYFKENILSCHYCNFKTTPPQICPHCNSSYIRYSGIGTQKLESELARLFPLARIKRVDKSNDLNLEEADIFVATQAIIHQEIKPFDFVGVLAIDNSLNRLDFRASEKTFALLVGLLGLCSKKMVIQTVLASHYSFMALERKDINLFYNEELRQRRQLKFPPYRHLAIIKLRGEKEERVKKLSEELFKKLTKYKKNKDIEVVSVNPAQPPKVRGKFWWQILLKAKDAFMFSKFLKRHLKNFAPSGIIVTVDIDPV
ncbi:MAG: primosomal protein N' [Candidatus Omnitrophica bacterium]|nr:primosomal protein N' [Candidatus Omnitrophota bacterium]